jgi:hypothetical protein
MELAKEVGQNRANLVNNTAYSLKAVSDAQGPIAMNDMNRNLFSTDKELSGLEA